MYYLAYGSNMDKQWMLQLCPNARVVTSYYLTGYRLQFKGEGTRVYATVEETFQKEDVVPMLLWQISPKDELALDCYEDYPNLYRKAYIPVMVENKCYEALIYMMNSDCFGLPSAQYYNLLEKAYMLNGFDLSILTSALKM